MTLLDMEYLRKVEEYMDSGDMAFEFENGLEEQRYQILDFLEKLMELGEKADKIATKLIFKEDYLEAALGEKAKDQK